MMKQRMRVLYQVDVDLQGPYKSGSQSHGTHEKLAVMAMVMENEHSGLSAREVKAEWQRARATHGQSGGSL